MSPVIPGQFPFGHGTPLWTPFGYGAPTRAPFSRKPPSYVPPGQTPPIGGNPQQPYKPAVVYVEPPRIHYGRTVSLPNRRGR
jgi:hypothetical protein